MGEKKVWYPIGYQSTCLVLDTNVSVTDFYMYGRSPITKKLSLLRNVAVGTWMTYRKYEVQLHCVYKLSGLVNV